MSQANVEQFIQLAAQDTTLQEQLKSSTSMPDFQTRMVDLGKQKGLIFTQDDVASYMQSQAAQTTGRSPNEKLTEEELETVGGGTAVNSLATIHSCIGACLTVQPHPTMAIFNWTVS
jgi:predicted ribosomally synthesized peptide with nif11-like leader